MTREQIVLGLQQEYAHRREENMRVFEERQETACQQCDGLRELLLTRHSAVMQGVRNSILSKRKDPQSTTGLGQKMAALNQEIARKLAEAKLPADFLQPVYTCAECRDEGYVYDPSRRMCDCFAQELKRRMLAESGISDAAPDFEDFDETLFLDETDEKKRNPRKAAVSGRNACMAYADSFPGTPVRDLLLIGKSGLGKTFLLQCIARRVAQRGYMPTYTSAYRLFEVARQAYMENDPELMRTYMDAPLLLIDDLGTEPMMNNVTVPQLFNLLNERQMAGRHTVISTNLSMSELQDRYTERITSRFLDARSCRRLVFVGSDIRKRLNGRADKA